jgi:hypothetical protein
MIFQELTEVFGKLPATPLEVFNVSLALLHSEQPFSQFRFVGRLLNLRLMFFVARLT